MTTAANAATNLNLYDLTKRMAPNGSIEPDIVELLKANTPLLEDAVFKTGNLPTGNRVTSRTGLPSLGWRYLNKGVAASKSRTDQYDEACGMLEGWSVTDAALAALNGNVNASRASEDTAFTEAMSTEVETGFFYHSTSSAPEKFQGLSPRYASTTGVGGKQIILADASASGSDQTSLWLVGWGDRTVYGIVPKGSASGLQFKDHGLRPWDDGTGALYEAYVGHWSWHVGFCVQDYRYISRIANIDTSALTASGSTGADLIDCAIKAYHKIHKPSAVRLAWYGNRTLCTYLHLQAKNSTKNSTLTIENTAGQPVTMLLGIPVRQTDGITDTEAVVS